MLKLSYSRIIPLFVTMTTTFTAQADSSFELARSFNGLETYISISLKDEHSFRQNATMIQKLMTGDLSELKPVDQIAAPVERSISLGDITKEDINVVVSLAGKVIIKEGAKQSGIDISFYTTDSSLNNNNSINVQSNKNTLAIQATGQSHICALSMIKGLVMSVQGSCTLVTISVVEGGKIKVYQNGKFKSKSQAARIDYNDVKQAFSTSSSEGKDLLNEYLKQDSARLDEVEFKKLVLDTSGSSYKIDFLRSAKNAIDKISGKTFIAIIKNIQGPSYQIEAIGALEGKANLNSHDLIATISSISGPSYKNDALSLLVKYVQFSEDAVVAIIQNIPGPSYQNDALKIMLSNSASISGHSAQQIIDAISGPSYKVDAIQTLISKVPEIDRMSLNNYAIDKLPGSYAKDASAIIMPRK